MPDHDFPVPGYLLIPSGYMRFEKKPSEGGQTMFLEGEDMMEYRDEGLNDTCSMSISTAAQYMAGSSRVRFQPQEQESLRQTNPVVSLPSTTVSTTCTTTMGSSTKISIRVNSRATSSQTTTLCVELSEGNSVQHISVSTSASITPGTSQTGTPDTSQNSTPGTSQSITSSTAPDMIKVSLNRPHFKVPHTGSTTVCLRSAKFHSSTCEMHIHDLKPILEAIVSEGKTVVTLIVDGGPDWSTSSLLNALYFMRLWKACNLDMLCVTSFAARYSAYNPIEHLWSVLSKKLASVRLSAVATGDDKAPYYISGISEDQRKAKESQVFDNAIEQIVDVDWNKAVFDGFPIIPVPIKCSDHFASDHDKVHRLLKAPLKEIRDGSTHTVLLNQFKFLLEHVDRHHNEIIFLKCNEITCSHCTKNPVRATEVFSFLKERKMKLFYPMPSKDHKGHFCTFLEMCNVKPEELPDPDQHLPSYDSDLGHCTYCPKFVFMSKTEKKRHFQVYHPKRTTTQKRNPRKKKATSRQVKHATTSHQLFDTPEPLNSPNMSEDEGGNSSDDSEAPHNESDHNLLQSPPIPSTSCPETADKGDDSTLCVVCELGEDEDEEDEVWIECTQCYRWVHESCLLPNYQFSPQDKDFLCPNCHKRSTRRRTK